MPIRFQLCLILLVIILWLPGEGQKGQPSAQWVSDSGYAEVLPGDHSEGGTLEARSPAPSLSYCTHKLCIDKQSGPVRYYPVMWTAKEWKIRYVADPDHWKKRKETEEELKLDKTSFLGVTLSVKFVADPAADSECTGSLLDARELKPAPLGNNCFVYQKAR